MINTISADDLYNAIQEKKDFVLIDVRTPEENKRGTIENSINVVIDNLDSTIIQTIPDKTKTVYLFCASGARSEIGADVMQKLGYTNVFSLQHGILMWRMKKYPEKKG
ncbi:MAG: rhodanese-like domain-containing protein [Candidatus Roizmanbacteria bacterium]